MSCITIMEKQKKEIDWSKYNKRLIAFKCPPDLLEIFENTNGKNKTDILIDALKSYRSKEFREKLLNSYIKYNAFFKDVSEFYNQLENILDIGGFIEILDKNLKENDLNDINQINEVLGL